MPDTRFVGEVLNYAAQFGVAADFDGPGGAARAAAFGLLLRISMRAGLPEPEVRELTAALGREPTVGDLLGVCAAVLPVPPEVVERVHEVLGRG